MKKRVMQIFTVILMSISLFSITAHASEVLSNVKEQNYAFWSPDSGTSSLKVSMSYVEEYTTSGSKNTFSKHSAFYGYNTVGATQIPTLKIDNISHYNGSTPLNTFSSLSSVAVINDPKWMHGGGRQSTTSVSYATTAKNTGKLQFTISCSGFTPPYYMDTVEMSLYPR